MLARRAIEEARGSHSLAAPEARPSPPVERWPPAVDERGPAPVGEERAWADARASGAAPRALVAGSRRAEQPFPPGWPRPRGREASHLVAPPARFP
eukprot:7991144-Alexandrium_andersonii.AAC.1